jgi:TetR/AcrR family transcriptional repressor of nem operon
MTPTEIRRESKTNLLNAALHVIRAKGYSATHIENICEAAGLTKGNFFHHFDNQGSAGCSRLLDRRHGCVACL